MGLTYILRNFLDGDGKLTAFPAKRKMKICCLFYLAQKFEAEKDCTETGNHGAAGGMPLVCAYIEHS